MFYDNNELKLGCYYLKKEVKLKEYINETNILRKQNYKEISNNKILYSELNFKYINDNILKHEIEFEEDDDEPQAQAEQYEYEYELDEEDCKKIYDSEYFILTPDGYVYHHDPEKSINKVKIQIKSEIEQPRNINSQQHILTFQEECIKKIEGSIRVVIKKVMEVLTNGVKQKELNHIKH